MEKLTKNTPKRIAFVDYRPAELKANKSWYIEYYAINPSTERLERFRNRVPKIKSTRERQQYAKKMANAINIKLQNGWSPFYEKPNNQYKSLKDTIDIFLKQTEKEVKDGIKRPDTLRAWKSFFSNIQKFIEVKRLDIKFVLNIDYFFVNNFLDYIYFEKNNSPSTYNNYLSYIKSFLDWAKNKGYIKQNPADQIKTKAKTQKKRVPLSSEVKQYIKELQQKDFHFYVCCMLTYYCFIRRIELTKLKVSDIHLFESRIVLDGSITKNKKTDCVTIPNVFLPDLAQHLATANNRDFLFSKDFKTGKTAINPKKISDTWAKYRKTYGFNDKYQFYSLKDTGIMDLLNAGIPSIKVRDQARHYDIKQTEAYTTRNLTADATIKNATFNF